MKVGIRIVPRPGLADPQGEAVQGVLSKLGFSNVQECAVGRWITVDVSVSDRQVAMDQVKQMCSQLFVNPVLEDYTLEILPGG